jgi:penicillin-binding protein 1B
LTQSLLEGVMNFGYGYEVRKHGFMAPAAGKTGTSHDVWFAAYTSNLICVVWVGNDDYTDVKLSGALAAAPIWAEFMNRAIKLPQYSDVKSFIPPEGITTARIDKTTNLLVDSTCPNNSFYIAFLDGTAPQSTCSQMGENPQNFIQKIFGIGGKSAPPDTTNLPSGTGAPIVRVAPNSPPDGNAPDTTQNPAQPKKKNFFQKIFGGGKDKQQQQLPQPQPAQPPPQ